MQLSLLSPLQNICPSNVAASPLSPREVACPVQDGQVCAGPGPSVIKRPSCAVTSGIEAGVIHDPVSAPSEGHTQTLTGQHEGKAMHGISMKDDRVVPSLHPGGRHLRMLAYPPARVQDGPSSAMSVNKKREHHISPAAGSCVSFQRRVTHPDRKTEC